MSFERQDKPLAYYREEALKLKHGFCEGALSFKKGSEREEASEKFCRAFEIKRLNLLNQKHTSNYVIVEPETDYREVEADAFIIPFSAGLKGQGFGILTADCVPVIIGGQNIAALIHAGWRGIAGGIIEAVISKIVELSSEPNFISLVGPCAGAEKYEVGREVIEAISDDAVYKELNREKALLNLQATVARKIKKSSPESSVRVLERCVISNPSFHSFRRDGERSGRNLSFCLF